MVSNYFKTSKFKPQELSAEVLYNCIDENKFIKQVSSFYVLLIMSITNFAFLALFLKTSPNVILFINL